MKRLITGFLCAGLIVLGSGVRAQQQIEWVSQFGTSAEDLANKCGVDAFGNAYVSGGTAGTLPGQVSAGLLDAFLRKYAPDGTVVWTRQFGTSDGDVAFVSVHQTGVYVLMHTRPGAMIELRKYDFDGNELLRKTLITGASIGIADGGFRAHATGLYWAGGWGGGGTFPGNPTGRADAFVQKLDFDGNEVWTRFFSTPTSQSWDEYSGVSADATQIYVSRVTFVDAGNQDLALHAYDLNGTLVWQRQIARTGSNQGSVEQVHADASGIYVAGSTHGVLLGQSSLGGVDAFLVKFDTAGNQLWSRQFGTAGNDSARAVSADPTGVYVGGLGNSDPPLLAKFDHDGGALGFSLLDASGAVYGVQGMCASPLGVYAAGRVSGSLLGQPVVGGVDAFALKLAPPDTTPPVITSIVTPAPNSAGWHNTNVTVTWEVGDPESGIASLTGCGPTALTSETAGTTATCSATNGAGLSSSKSVTIRIDKTPPTVACSANPNLLWPPNHRLVGVVTNVTVSDSLSGSSSFALLAATSNEPDNGLGDGDTPNDIQGWDIGTPDTSGELRAERAGKGTGRTYTLGYQGSDRAGNSSPCATAVAVPRDQGQK